jgi:hypothetical protein
VVLKLRFSPEIGELQICSFVFELSELSESLVSVSEPLPECSLAGPSAGSSVGSGCTSYWCMSSRSGPRYGWLVLLLCSNSCHHPRYSITAVGLPCSLFSGMNSQMSYPLLLDVWFAGTNCTLLFVWLLGPVASCCWIQMHLLCSLPVPLELAVIERSRV